MSVTARGIVDIRLSVSGDNATTELRSLHTWLRGVPELAGLVTIVRGEPADGTLGSGSIADVVAVAVGSGGTITVLASSLKGWLSRPRSTGAKLHIKRNGPSVEIEATGLSDSAVERAIKQALNGKDLP